MQSRERVLKYHEERRGTIQVVSNVSVGNPGALSLAYAPRVAEPCVGIGNDPNLVNRYINRANTVAIVTDGTAVLGLGDIAPIAVNAILFEIFGGVDAFPIWLDIKDLDKMAETVRLLQPSFGGVNLEDVTVAHAFGIEESLRRILSVSVFNDDQHGTAVVIGVALTNALRITGRKIHEVRIVFNGAGTAVISVAQHLLAVGGQDIGLVDRRGLIYQRRVGISSPFKGSIAQVSNWERRVGDLEQALLGGGVFIELSAADALTLNMMKGMNPQSIVFALAKSVSESWSVLALEAGAQVAGTGRCNVSSPIHNVLRFPGIFRRALDAGEREINLQMRLAAFQASAPLISESEMRDDYIIPQPMDRPAAPEVAALAALEPGGATRNISAKWDIAYCRHLVNEVLGMNERFSKRRMAFEAV